MILLVIAIAVVLGLTLLLSSGAAGLVGLTSDQAGSLIPAVVLLGVLGAALLARRHRAGEFVGNFVLWIGIFGVVILGYSYRDEFTAIGSRVFGELIPGQAVIDPSRGSATFRRGRDGHYQINANINGSGIPLIFDTGASAVVLTASDARRVGIDTRTLTYSIAVSTANGTGRAAPVILDQIEIGGIVRNRIRAFVAQDGALETSLLGMTFLETLHSYSVTQGGLELVG